MSSSPDNMEILKLKNYDKKIIMLLFAKYLEEINAFVVVIYLNIFGGNYQPRIRGHST